MEISEFAGRYLYRRRSHIGKIKEITVFRAISIKAETLERQRLQSRPITCKETSCRADMYLP
jgi:hypothetical protein